MSSLKWTIRSSYNSEGKGKDKGKQLQLRVASVLIPVPLAFLEPEVDENQLPGTQGKCIIIRVT